jgi:hypothetical protein
VTSTRTARVASRTLEIVLWSSAFLIPALVLLGCLRSENNFQMAAAGGLAAYIYCAARAGSFSLRASDGLRQLIERPAADGRSNAAASKGQAARLPVLH